MKIIFVKTISLFLIFSANDENIKNNEKRIVSVSYQGGTDFSPVSIQVFLFPQTLQKSFHYLTFS
jgi:hypothetical protein